MAIVGTPDEELAYTMTFGDRSGGDGPPASP